MEISMENDKVGMTLEAECLDHNLEASGVGIAEEWRVEVRKKDTRFDMSIVGKLVAFQDGVPMVTFPDNPAGALLVARSTVSLRETDIGSEAVLIFEQGDPQKPIVIGLLEHPDSQGRKVVELDGDKLILSAEREIVLRCGQASITLTRAGKLLLRGGYLLSRSSGVNRIRGAAVQIN